MNVPNTLLNNTIADANEVMENFNYLALLISGLPRGTMLNGKLSVTDTGSGIQVALKTLAGTDPSATDPVEIKINSTWREVTAALSITLADGTNWFNAGSSELATKEIDYFVYAVWDSNSNAVALSFARIPYCSLVSQFSATTTNEKYCAGQSGFTSTDEVEVIGRFAATLSAGAGYTWSVPTYTAINLIQRPIYETQLLSWSPTWTGYSANPTGNRYYRIINDRCHLYLHNTGLGTSNTTGNSFTVPFAPSSTVYGTEFRECNGFAVNNSNNSSTVPRVEYTGGSNVFTWSIDPAGNAWTSSGTKHVQPRSGYNYAI